MIARINPWTDTLRDVQYRVVDSGLFSHWYYKALLAMKERYVYVLRVKCNFELELFPLLFRYNSVSETYYAQLIGGYDVGEGSSGPLRLVDATGLFAAGILFLTLAVSVAVAELVANLFVGKRASRRGSKSA